MADARRIRQDSEANAVVAYSRYKPCIVMEAMSITLKQLVRIADVTA
jgi:hypothetical protein